MNLRHEAPSCDRMPRNKKAGRYAQLFKELDACPGEWLSIPLEEVAGEGPKDKQRVIYSAAFWRKVKVQTTVQDGKLFIRRKA